MQPLINEEDPSNNEFFKLKQIFDQIAEDPKTANVTKMRILMKKAQELYNYMQKIETDVKIIKAMKFKIGSIEPVFEEMTPQQAIKEADRSFQIYMRYDIAKYNFMQVIESFNKRLNQFSIYDPFFQHIMQLIAVMQPQFKQISKLEKRDEEKRSISRELTEVRKQNLYCEEQIKELNKKIKEQNEAWELSVTETFAHIADNFEKWKFISSLPQWDDLKPEDVGTISKIVSYCIVRGKDTIKTVEIEKDLKITDVTALLKLPFIKMINSTTFKIDYDGLKMQLAKKKINFKVDPKNWMVDVKSEITKYIDKVKKKITNK